MKTWVNYSSISSLVEPEAVVLAVHSPTELSLPGYGTGEMGRGAVKSQSDTRLCAGQILQS